MGLIIYSMNKQQQVGVNKQLSPGRQSLIGRMWKNRLHFGVGVLVMSILLSSLTVLLPTKNASAAPEWSGSSFIADEVYKTASTHQHYFWLYSCFRNSDIDKVTESELDSWDFFQRYEVDSALGVMYPGESSMSTKEGMRDCQTQSIVKTAFGYLGFTNPREVFCSLEGFQYKNDSKGDKDDCIAGIGEGHWDNGAENAAVAKSFEKLAASKKPALGGAGEYVRAYASLISQRGCKMTFQEDTLYESSGAVPGTDSDSKYAVPVFVKDGNSYVLRYILGTGLPNEQSEGELAYVATTANSVSPWQLRSCNSIVNIARDNAAAYAQWLAQNPEAAESSDIDRPEGTEVAGDTISTCAIDGVGWIVCPVMVFIGEMNDAAFEFLEGMLSIRPAIVTSESTQNAWAAFRDIANVAFAIAFMIIVYSQLTSAGISNYGIKKMLPRIVIAAILVNVSFIVTAIAVDISNIAGASIHTLLKDSIAPDVGGEVSNGAWEEAIAGALAATTAIAVTLIVVLFFIGPMALLALGMIVLILVARQALVILLIVVAPLAFVAYLLPNTEDWFKKWYKAFIAVLMVYPIVGAVFGASALASRVLSSVAADTEDSSLLQVIALGVLAIPLFAVPAILKGSLSAAGSIGARVSGLADKAQGKASSRGMKRLGDATGDAKNRWNLAAANGKLGKKPWTPGGLTRRGMRRDFLRSSREAEAKRAQGAYTTELLHGDDEQSKKYQRAAGGGRAGGDAAAVRAAARATQQGHKQYDEDVSAHKTTMTGLDHAQLMAILRDKTQSSERRAAAAGMIMSRDYRAGHLEALQAAGEIGQAGDDDDIGDIQKQMAHDMSDKPFALGDQAAGQLKIGTYGKPQPPVTNADGTTYQPPQLGDLDAELRQRVEEKLSPASLAKMNPDEMTKIFEMSQKAEADGGLSAAQKANLVKAIQEARADDQYKGLIKPNEQKKHDKILQDAAASSYGPNI